MNARKLKSVPQPVPQSRAYLMPGAEIRIAWPWSLSPEQRRAVAGPDYLNGEYLELVLDERNALARAERRG